MAAMKKRIQDNVIASKTGPCLGYAYDDEISAVSFTSPCDTCTSQWCLPRFRAFLEKMYGSIDALNAQWGSEYESFDQISIVGTEKTRIANDPQRLSNWNLSGWVDSTLRSPTAGEEEACPCTTESWSAGFFKA